MYDYFKVMFSCFEDEINSFSFKTCEQRNVFVLAYEKLKSSVLLTAYKSDEKDKEVSRCTVSDDDVSDVQED